MKAKAADEAEAWANQLCEVKVVHHYEGDFIVIVAPRRAIDTEVRKLDKWRQNSNRREDDKPRYLFTIDGFVSCDKQQRKTIVLALEDVQAIEIITCKEPEQSDERPSN